MTRIQSRMPQRRPGHPAQNETGQAITLHFVLNALRRWWKVATPVGLVLAVCAAGLIWLTFKPMYSAWTTIRIKDTAPYLAFRVQDNTRSFVQTQKEMIRHPHVLWPALNQLPDLPKLLKMKKSWEKRRADLLEKEGEKAVLRDPELKELAEVLKDLPELEEMSELKELKKQENQLAWLSQRIGVVQRGESELYDITFVGPNSDDAKAIVWAVNAAYFTRYRDSGYRHTQTLIDLLMHEEVERKRDVEALRNYARELAIENTDIDPYEVRSLSEPNEDAAYASVRSQLVNSEVESTIIEARVKVLEECLGKSRQLTTASTSDDAAENVVSSDEEAEVAVLTDEEIEQQIAELVPTWMVEQAVHADPEVQLRQQELMASSSKLSDIERIAVDGKESDQYKELFDKIANEQAGLDTFCEDLAIRHRASLVEQRVFEQESELTALKLALTNHQILMETLEEKRDEQENIERVYRGETFDMEIADRDFADAKKVLDLITARRIQLVAEKKADDRVTLFQSAVASKIPSDPMKKMLLAALAGLLLPFGLAVLWERLAKRVAHPQDLQRQSTLPVVGEIARIPSRARAAGGFASGSGGFALGMFEESIDSLRTNLVLSEDLQEMRVLAVTSAVNHEGKTSVSAQLAISLARASGKKTLLIDGDMRCPDIHNVFDIPLEPGLAELLSGECSLEDAIVTDWSDHVHLIPAGKLRMSPHKLLGNGSAKELLASISDIYRYIVIDTPPVLAASEALVLAKAADASLICAMQDVSRIDQVTAACDRLASAGSRPVGTVLNGVPTKRYAYRYGSYAYSRQ